MTLGQDAMKRHLHILNLVLHADRRTTLPTKRMIRNNSALYSKSQKALLLKEGWLHPSDEYYPVFLEATFRGLWDPKDDLSGDLNLIDNTLSSSNVPVEKQNLNNKLSVWQHVGYQHANKVLEVLTIHYSGCIVALPGPEKSAFLPPRQLALITSLLFHVRFVMSRETI